MVIVTCGMLYSSCRSGCISMVLCQCLPTDNTCLPCRYYSLERSIPSNSVLHECSATRVSRKRQKGKMRNAEKWLWKLLCQTSWHRAAYSVSPCTSAFSFSTENNVWIFWQWMLKAQEFCQSFWFIWFWQDIALFLACDPTAKQWCDGFCFGSCLIREKPCLWS